MTGIETAITALLKARDDEAARVAQAAQARAAAASDKIATLGTGLTAAGRATSAASAADQKELIDLLDAKVKVKAVLGSDSVKEQYPGLSSSLDRYLQLYGEEQSAKGRGVALQDIGTVLDYMLGRKQSTAVTPIWTRYGDDAERAAFLQLLDRLRGLYQ